MEWIEGRAKQAGVSIDQAFETIIRPHLEQPKANGTAETGDAFGDWLRSMPLPAKGQNVKFSVSLEMPLEFALQMQIAAAQRGQTVDYIVAKMFNIDAVNELASGGQADGSLERVA